MRWFPSFNSLSPTRKDLQAVGAIRRRMAEFQGDTDVQLREHVERLRTAMLATTTNRLEQPKIDAFALISEAMRRTTGKIYYDVQLLGGTVLSRGAIAEMQTGEGKTITTALPAFVLALYGRGVHVATTNTYLAERDCEEVRPALELLGITVGLLPDEHDAQIKTHAYRCDVTYGTGYEFGFDFLRDQIALRNQPRLRPGTRHIRRLRGQDDRIISQLQRPHAFAIIDEADSVIIDEATMPLILSSERHDASAQDLLILAKQTAEQLEPDTHYEIDDANKAISFTDEGWVAAHEPLYQQQARGLTKPWSTYVEHALRAIHFLKRDVDYVVRDNKVQIVDQNTGRIHEERSWRDGLHQSVELREGLEISPEKDSDGRISRQRYFRFYEQLCGMTGTASGNESEFKAFYKLPVVEIPTHRPCQRIVLPTRGFVDDAARNTAILHDTIERHQTGQPVLIGTRTIAHSHRLHDLLSQHQLPHTVLNGVQDEEESHIVSQAGARGAITIATNMAGRGTDIKPDAQALQIGGLHVIAAEHNFSPRVDRQLSGRAARQGDPGSAQFFVAAEDEIFVAAESDLPQNISAAAGEDGEARMDIDSPVRNLQIQLETKSFQRRQEMFQRDHWMESVMELLAKRG